MDKIIETKRMLIRPFTHMDIEPSYLMNKDPEVSRYTGDGGVVSREEVHRRITEDVLGDYEKYGYGRMAVCLKPSMEFIGFCGLKYLDDLKETDLGYRLKKEHWGKGLATEACTAILDFGFRDLKLPAIVALVMKDNRASIRVLEKLGFIQVEETTEDGIPCFKYEKANPN